MKIYRAVRTNTQTQGFGANTNPTLLKWYQETFGINGHDGFDWAAGCYNSSVKTGGQCENVYFDTDGKAKITYIQKDVKNGYGIIAVSEDKDGIMKHLWWHFDSINPALKVGDTVESADFLGVAGNTGNTTGAHLHRALYPYNEPQDNGYHGAVDMTPYFTNIFIVDLMDNLTKQVGLLQKLINFLLGKK